MAARLSFRPPILQTRSPGSETFPLPQTECLSLLCVVSSYKTSSIFRSFTALHLSFVGSFKCYTFVKFVTFTLYQLAIRLSTSLTDFSLTSLDSQKFLYYSFFLLLSICFINYFVTFYRKYSILTAKILFQNNGLTNIFSCIIF